MADKKQSIQDRLLAAQVAIDNALSDTEVQTFLAEYGYDNDRISQGKTLLENTQQLHQQQQKEYGDQFAATDALNKSWADANVSYMRFVKIARIALKSDHAAYKKLDLTGNRKQTLSGWLGQAKQFYLNALSDKDVLEKMANFGITQEKLEAGKQLVEATETANAKQEKEKGEAQQATLERDKVFDRLEDWLSDFLAIARIALEDKPQLLEKLGVVEPSI